ncbi:MAG: hypothetical protein DWQ44_08870 [Bacteroidetes bacterium]|nr:MAG: hypothetical protein DWQ33_13795 [Bacteroidota bacterium]REK07665.1 MAG: hypothetical protein DWQ39_01120 [Bacteroidota bacterium]REK33735.1 MAG: hypothetical protein DWQ44_08870 [Bacteroidota bacterium]REK49205.1 MAG: hypothetical protein DWQ48_08070 [Bacteroidota bacterium]
MKKRALILSYYFPPSGGSGVQRWMFFSRYLNEFGIEPVVVTVKPEEASYKFLDNTLLDKVSHVKVKRTSTMEPLGLYAKIRGGEKSEHIPQGFAGESNPTFFQKLSRMIRGNVFLPDARKGWNLYAIAEARKIISTSKVDVIISTGPPHSTHLAGMKLKAEFRLPWIADFRDPWTEVYYNKMLYRSSWANERDRKMEKEVLEKCDVVLTVGPGMASSLESKLPFEMRGKVKYIYNGYDEEVFTGIQKLHHPDKFVICHTGILSENQPIDAFLDSMHALLEKIPALRSQVQMQFVGKVSPSILEKAEKVFGQDHLQVTGYVPHSLAVQYMMNADLLLNSFAETADASVLVSGKLMEYLASGNPMLGLGDPNGDAAKLMSGSEQTRIFSRADKAGISGFIEKIYFHKINGQGFAPADFSKYSRKNSTALLASLIDSLI